jgi:uncharacterized membrane protein
MKLVSLAATALVAMLSAAHAADTRLADNVITFKVCNHSGKQAFVGSSFIPVNGTVWRNEGWKFVAANACRDIFTTMNHTFYARAEVKGDPDTYWGKGIKQCVLYPGPYDFMTGSNDTTCPKGEPAEMTVFKSDGTPTFTWTLNP